MDIKIKRIILTIILFLFIPQLHFVTDCPVRTAPCEDSLTIGLTYNFLFDNSVSIFRYGHWDYSPLFISSILIALIVAYLISCLVFRKKVIKKKKVVKKKKK